MKKIMTAALALSFLSAGGAIFAQNTSTDTGSTMKSTKKSKHHKSKKTDTTSTTSTTK
jgi:uncharacterized protein YxeA